MSNFRQWPANCRQSPEVVFVVNVVFCNSVSGVGASVGKWVCNLLILSVSVGSVGIFFYCFYIVFLGVKRKNSAFYLAIPSILTNFASPQVRERGENLRLSRSCKQPKKRASTMSLILLGRRLHESAAKSEYLPECFDVSASTLGLVCRMRYVYYYISPEGLCREAGALLFKNEK